MLRLTARFSHGTCRTLTSTISPAATAPVQAPADSSSNSANTKRSISQMPGPAHIPWLYNKPQLLWDRLVIKSGVHNHYKAYQKYGPIWKYQLSKDLHLIHIHEPSDYEKVFRAEGKNPVSSVLSLWPLIEYNEKHGHADANLIGLRGEAWRSVRVPVQDQIFSVAASRSYTNMLTAIVEEACEILPEHSANLEDWSNMLTFELICAVLFNRRIGSLDNLRAKDASRKTSSQRFVEETMEMMRIMGIMLSIPHNGLARTLYAKQFAKCMDFIYQEGGRLIGEAQKELEKDPSSEEYKSAAKSYVGRNILSKTLTLHQLSSNINVFLFAGVDTTATSIRWMLINLAQNPAAQEKLRAEFKEKLNGATVNEEALKNTEFPYFRAVLKESFRVTPTAGGIMRQVNSDKEFVLRDYVIPKGSFIVYSPHPILNDSKRMPDAEKFNPDRWLQQENRTELHSKFAHIQFGLGPRQCLGEKLANIEMMMVMSRLLQDYHIELYPKQQTWTPSSVFTTLPKPMPSFRFTKIQ